MSSRNPSTSVLKTDIVVIGGGGASMASAVQAAEKRAKVILLEKRGFLGGNSAMANELFAAESPVEKRMGLRHSRDYFYQYAMEWHHWHADARLVRAYVDKTGDTIAWLEGKGVEFTGVTDPGPRYVRAGHHTKGKTGATIIKALAKSAEKLGVKVFLKSPAKKILTDRKGNVTGVLATTDGKELRIDAKSVIITTGGYAGSKRLMKKYCPAYTDDIVNIGVNENTGDGLLMAIEAGAATDDLGTFFFGGPRYSRSFGLVNMLHKRPEMVWINANGERYCNECVVSDLAMPGNAVSRQPGMVTYTIFDKQIVDNLTKEKLLDIPATKPPVYITDWTDLPKDLEHEAERGHVKISNSWAEIAKWIGVAPAVLKATIDEYNSFCDHGHDETFCKDRRYLLPLRTPPYYVLKGYLGLVDTTGGIKVNHHLEVLNEQYKPIPGLYAAGVCCGGWQSQSYCSFLRGSLFGFALNSGRIAGESAAKYALGK